jgi:hypothetical protein
MGEFWEELTLLVSFKCEPKEDLLGKVEKCSFAVVKAIMQ